MDRNETVRRNGQGKKVIGSNDSSSWSKATILPQRPAWQGGLVQKQASASAVSRAMQMTGKPLAQYEDNAERDRAMRATSRWEDPMKGEIGVEKAKNMLETRRRYRGPPPEPNRFGIEPGYEWDGIDRSNGFEREFFRKAASERENSKFAYKVATENM